MGLRIIKAAEIVVKSWSALYGFMTVDQFQAMALFIWLTRNCPKNI